MLTGCSGRGGAATMVDMDGYEQALRDFPGSTQAIDEGLARFQATFDDLTAADIADRFRETYAEQLFFNDTLHSFDKLADLADYMGRTGAGLSESSVVVHQTVRDGADVFVRWTMEFKTRAAGRNIHSHSIGMTHLRFNESGKVVLHQDFWDSGHALYAHLPVVGFAVRRARSAM
ncbi:MAG: nuclear transport factor 2 family protein [Wenzhouxiangella sp.]